MKLRRPHLFWFNLSLTIGLIIAMVGLRLEPATVFMCGTVLALTVNYPNLKQQAERIDSHARAALLMAAVLFAAGAFTGILGGTGMLMAMAKSVSSHVPVRMAGHMPFVLGLV